MRKTYIYRSGSLYPTCSRHIVQHADAEINVKQVALALGEMRQITAIILSIFMYIFFGIG